VRENRPDTDPILPGAWWVAAGLLFLGALGPTWNIGDTPITPHHAVLALPGMAALYDLFRSAGRFTWPLAYSILLWVVDALARQQRLHLLLTLTVLQLLELNMPLLVKLGSNHRHRLEHEADPVRQWKAREPALAAALAQSTLTILGTTRRREAVPPAYAPQVLNPAIESNWGGEGITRLPRSEGHRNALDTWIAAVEERRSRGLAPLGSSEQVLVISEDPNQRARLTALAHHSGLTLAEVGTNAIVLRP
jgi:hypothetical protein